MPGRSSKPPRDANQAARRALDLLTDSEPVPSEEEERPVKPERENDPAAVSLGHRGGLKGGKARAEKMTAEARSEVARKVVDRWSEGCLVIADPRDFFELMALAHEQVRHGHGDRFTLTLLPWSPS